VRKPFKPIRTLSKSKEVFQILREAILSGELQPGESLKEAHLARQLHVSQVHLGLVVRIQDKGTTVTKLSRAEMVELLEVRAHLEDLAFRLAARHLTEKGKKELRDCVADLENKITQNNYYGAAEADLRFHRTVWSYSGNRVLENTLERLCTSVLAFVSIQRHSAKESLRDSVGRHKHLLDVLEEGKAKSISLAIREHMNPSHSIPSNVVD
jgi:DNA-binding GntR family transcriptional regulator